MIDISTFSKNKLKQYCREIAILTSVNLAALFYFFFKDRNTNKSFIQIIVLYK